jgi:hypothetical protein
MPQPLGDAYAVAAAREAARDQLFEPEMTRRTVRP